jgi:hypothetical protein
MASPGLPNRPRSAPGLSRRSNNDYTFVRGRIERLTTTLPSARRFPKCHVTTFTSGAVERPCSTTMVSISPTFKKQRGKRDDVAARLRRPMR